MLSKIKNPTELGPPYIEGPALTARLHSAATKVNFDLVRICPLLKNPSFSEEREWRLVLPISIDKQQLQNPRLYRPARDRLVPYIAYPLCGEDEPVPVNDLTLGPGSHPEAKAAMIAFLQANQIMVMPRASEVPYRPW